MKVRRSKYGGGSKRDPKPGERVMLGTRVTPELKRRLDAAAEHNGRSQAQEIEFRLERSFDRESLLSEVMALTFSRELAGLLLAVGWAMDRVGWSAQIQPGRRNWFGEPFAYDQAVRAANKIFEAARPTDRVTTPAGADDQNWDTIAFVVLLAIANDPRGTMYEGEGAIAGSLLGSDAVKRIEEYLRKQEEDHRRGKRNEP